MEQLSLTKNTKSNKELIFTILRKKAYLKLYKKYSSNSFSFNTICINNIIFNESCLIVAKFKDFLIFDDNTEFLRNYYNMIDINKKLYKILDLYENYSKIFPNYLVVKERKFMYKNIRKKQKMIDAFNQIKIEEEENRRKIKEKQEENENNDNKLFTDLVKDEIKLFQKDNNNEKYKSSFNSESEKDNTDTMFGQSHSSISINLINKSKKYLLSQKDNKKISFDYSKNNETDGTISYLLNVMNDSKIYSKDLLNLFRINNISKNEIKKNNIIEKKIISFKNKKNINKEKINEIKSYSTNDNNINKNVIFQNYNKLTPEKRQKEVNKIKYNIHFNSTYLSKKRIKMLNPTLINANSNSITNKEKNIPNKQNIYLPSIANTIININNNFYSQASKTERLEHQRLINKNAITHSSGDKENEIINNKLVLINHKNDLNIKYKRITKDFSWKKKLNTKKNNKIDKDKLKIKNKRELSPQFELKLDLMKNHIINKNYSNIKGNILKKKDEIIKNYNKSKKNEKMKKNFTENKINTLKNNKRLIKNNTKLTGNEYSLLSLINIAKTESNIKDKKFTNNTKNKKNNFKENKEKQKTCFYFLKTKTFKKDINLNDKFFTTLKKEKAKNNNILKGKNDLIIKKHNSKSNKSSQSRDKTRYTQNFHSIKNKILNSETRLSSKKYFSNYIYKTKNKNNKKSFEKNNIYTAYSTINGNKNNNKKKILLDSKSIEKKKKCESIDFTNREIGHKNFFSKIESIKRNSYIYSPKNSFSHFIKSNDKRNNIINGYLTERTSYIFNQSGIPKQNISKINQSEIRNKYKTILLTKNNKKSYDFNWDIQKRYKQNILDKINNLKNTNKNACFSSIRKSFNSIDINGLKHNDNLYSNSFKNKSIEKIENNNSFKKSFNFKIKKNKKEEKITKNNNINNNNHIQSNNLPLTIRVNTCNFLLKKKGKLRMIYDKKKNFYK